MKFKKTKKRQEYILPYKFCLGSWLLAGPVLWPGDIAALPAPCGCGSTHPIPTIAEERMNFYYLMQD